MADSMKSTSRNGVVNADCRSNDGLVAWRRWRLGVFFAKRRIRGDFLDNWATGLRDGDSRSAWAWTDAVFTVQFRPMLFLMRLRNAAVKLLGRQPGPGSADRLERHV